MAKVVYKSSLKKVTGLVAAVLGSTFAIASFAASVDGRVPDGGVHESHDSEIEQLYAIPDVVQASQVNEDTVGLIFSPDDLFESAVRNVDAEVSAHEGPRIIPILGKNHVQNVYDLLYLKNVDVALIHSDAIEYVKRIGNFPTVSNVVKSLVNIHRDKVLILAGKGIESVSDLEGKKVAMGYYTSGAYITGTVIMDILDVNVETVSANAAEALEQLSKGEIDAMVYLLHEEDHDDEDEGHIDPPGLRDVVEFDGASGVTVLELPQNELLNAVYSPTELTSEDLPLLISEGETVAAYEVNTILAAYRWRSNNPRYTKTQNFVGAFIDTVDHLKTGPQDGFWGDLEMDRAVPGVDRLAVVDEVMVIREEQRKAEIVAAREQAEAKLVAERLLRLEKLKSQQDVIERLIDQRVDDADLVELESLLDELNSFVEKLDGDSGN